MFLCYSTYYSLEVESQFFFPTNLYEEIQIKRAQKNKKMSMTVADDHSVGKRFFIDHFLVSLLILSREFHSNYWSILLHALMNEV